MKLLQVGWAHDRNREFIIRACHLYGIEYHHTHDATPPDYSYDIIWAPQHWINPDRYPHSKILFGPHFGYFQILLTHSLPKRNQSIHQDAFIYV